MVFKNRHGWTSASFCTLKYFTPRLLPVPITNALPLVSWYFPFVNSSAPYRSGNALPVPGEKKTLANPDSHSPKTRWKQQMLLLALSGYWRDPHRRPSTCFHPPVIWISMTIQTGCAPTSRLVSPFVLYLRLTWLIPKITAGGYTQLFIAHIIRRGRKIRNYLTKVRILNE